MSGDKIEIYKDEGLLSLHQKMGFLEKEEVEFIFPDSRANQTGRTPEDVARDMITVYEETNQYLQSHYPKNSLADIWIKVNQFSAYLLREHLGAVDPVFKGEK